MKVYFFLSTDKTSTTSYSHGLLAEGLKKHGYDVEIIRNTQEKFNLLKNIDKGVIIFQKTIQCKAHTSQAISHLKGKVYFVHIDDDYMDMQSEEHIRTLNITDLILVGSKKNKEGFEAYTTTPIEIVSGILDFENYPYVAASERRNNPLVISWQQRCADAYTDDLLSIKEPLMELHDKYNIRLDLYGWHMGKDYPDHSHKVRDVLPFAQFIEYVPIPDYFTQVVPKLAMSDIFIMPYINDSRRWGKSGFALKRMMLSGVPVVATATEHHATLIEQGISGFMASTDFEWFEFLEKLILDKNLRNTFSINARKYMEEKYNDHVTVEMLIQALKRHIPGF